MSKDTKNLGHGKALACESRGFVYAKKRGCATFDTPSSFLSMEKTTITFIVTKDCQLACKYCYLVKKNHKERMELPVAKQIVDFILSDSYLTSSDSVVFDFIGGEPLLEIDLIRDVMDYLCATMQHLNHKWKEAYEVRITTNGLLYDNPKVQDFVAKYRKNLSISISIDGTKQKNDSNRVFSNGSGSYDRIIDNIRLWTSQYPEATTKMVISHNDVSYVSESLKHLISLGIKRIDVNPVGQNVWCEGDDIIFESQLIEVADYIIANNLYQVLDISVFYDYIGENDPLASNQSPCGNMTLSVDCNGIFYSCLRFAKYSLNKRKPLIVGDITHGIN